MSATADPGDALVEMALEFEAAISSNYAENADGQIQFATGVPDLLTHVDCDIPKVVGAGTSQGPQVNAREVGAGSGYCLYVGAGGVDTTSVIMHQAYYTSNGVTKWWTENDAFGLGVPFGPVAYGETGHLETTYPRNHPSLNHLHRTRLEISARQWDHDEPFAQNSDPYFMDDDGLADLAREMLL